MRSRATLVFLVLVLATAAVVAMSPVASASTDGIVVAQQVEEGDAGGGEGEDPGEGAGQDDPDAETGASEEQAEEGTSAEATGPPWTYQMARISLILLVLLALGLGYLYYRLVTRRSRGEV